MLAAAVSIGLHGFLLTQWPSPVVQVPRWTSAETIRITYLPSPGPPRVDGVSRAAMRRLTPVHAAAASSGQEPRMANPAVPPLPSVAVPAAPPRPAPTVSSPPSSVSSPAIPSLLSPADFARFQYKQVIRERLRQGLRYPEGAGMTARGRVQLTMTLAPDGSVVTASCRSADRPVFEEATMQGVADTWFPPMPRELAGSPQSYEFLIAFTPDGETSVSP